MTAVTLTAGDYFGALQGFAGSGSGLSDFGSLGGQPLAGQVVNGLYTGLASQLTLAGDTTAVTSLTLTVDGASWAVGSPTYDSGNNLTGYPVSGGSFVNGNSYTVDLTTGGGSDTTPPTITSANSASVAENATLAHALTANETVTWSIVGGADQAKFEISGSTLRWASNGTKDYDAPDDADANNTYVVTVRAADTAGNTTDQTITVTVTNAYEGPTWVAATSGAAGNITFASSGRVSGDELLIAIVTANQAITTPTGFTEVPTVSPQATGTAAAIGGIRLGVFRKTSDGTEGAITITNPGNHVYAVGCVVRPKSGQSIQIDASAGKTAAAATSQSGNAVTTTVADCLVIDFFGTDRDSAGPSYSAQANASLANVTERFDAGTTNGVGSGIMISTGEKIAAGSVSATTTTSAASVAYCAITLALKSTTGGGGSTSVTPNNAAHAHAATQPSLAAKSSITPNSATHASSSTSPGLVAYDPSVAITVGNASHAQTATSPTITAKSSVSPSDAVHGQTSTSPTLSAKSAVSLHSAFHPQTSTQPTIAAKSSISPASGSHSHDATSPALTLGTIGITPENGIHGQISTQPVLAFVPMIVPAGSVHGHSATSPVIAVVGSVTVNGATHAQSATSPTLAAKASVTVNGATHGHIASEPTIGAQFSVAVNDNTLGHEATSPGLAFSFQVAPDSAWHEHLATSPALLFHRGDIRVPTSSRPTFKGTTRPATPITLRPAQLSASRPGTSITTRPRAISNGRRR